MFYEESEISELLKCPCCKQKYNDPRVLTCSHSLCQPCIDTLIDKRTNGVTCSECLKFNRLPVKQGHFPVNDFILKLIRKKPNDVYRGEKAECLKHQLDLLNQKCESIIDDFNTIRDKIKENSYDLRSKINKTTDEAIEQLKKFRLEFFDQILKFEKDCVANYEANGEILKNKLELLVNKIRPFYDDWKLSLSKPDLDEEKLKDANQLADLYINEIRFQQQLVRKFTFNNKMLLFEENKYKLRSIDCLGCLSLKNFDATKHKNININDSNTNNNKNYFSSSFSTGNASNNNVSMIETSSTITTLIKSKVYKNV